MTDLRTVYQQLLEAALAAAARAGEEHMTALREAAKHTIGLQSMDHVEINNKLRGMIATKEHWLSQWRAPELLFSYDRQARGDMIQILSDHISELKEILADLEKSAPVKNREIQNYKRKGFAQALRGMADGFDQQWSWLRPDPLVMSTLRRAADELDKENA